MRTYKEQFTDEQDPFIPIEIEDEEIITVPDEIEPGIEDAELESGAIPAAVPVIDDEDYTGEGMSNISSELEGDFEDDWEDDFGVLDRSRVGCAIFDAGRRDVLSVVCRRPRRILAEVCDDRSLCLRWLRCPDPPMGHGGPWLLWQRCIPVL